MKKQLVAALVLSVVISFTVAVNISKAENTVNPLRQQIQQNNQQMKQLHEHNQQLRQ